MKYLSYGWTILKNLITLGIVLAILNNLHTTFEVIVVTILILLYATMKHCFNLHHFTIMTSLDEIKKLLEKIASTGEYGAEQIKELINSIKTGSSWKEIIWKRELTEIIQIAIDEVILFVISLIALWNLFKEIL